MDWNILTATLAIGPVLLPLLYIAAAEPGWETRRQAQITIVCALMIITALTI
jgi:hypothetical protein